MPGIVLHEPEIPANTGNIGRTCVATGASLHLIEPLGFQLTERNLKRAGMDYWKRLDVTRYINYREFMERHKGATVWYATTKARRVYTDVRFGMDDFVMFGAESCIRIPMLPGERSLNLSNSVAVILYEMLRQNHFEGLLEYGELHRLHW